MRRQSGLLVALVLLGVGLLLVVAAVGGFFVWRAQRDARDAARLKELEAEYRVVGEEAAVRYSKWVERSTDPATGKRRPGATPDDDPELVRLNGRLVAVRAEHDAILDRHPDWDTPRLPREFR